MKTVIPFYRTILEGLGYEEAPDAFSIENIPSTVLDNSYHIEVEPQTGGVINQHVQKMTYPLMVRLFKKGYRDVNEARDEAVERVQQVLCEVLKPANRLAGPVIKNIEYNGSNIIALSGSNDNEIIIELNFSNKLFLEIN